MKHLFGTGSGVSLVPGLGCSPKKLFSCQLCGKVLCSKASLKRHIADKHAERQEEYRCIICERVYCSRNSLMTHIYTYHKSRPGELDIKDIKFFQWSMCTMFATIATTNNYTTATIANNNNHPSVYNTPNILNSIRCRQIWCPNVRQGQISNKILLKLQLLPNIQYLNKPRTIQIV